MPQSQISPTTIVVRGGRVHIPPGGGVTRGYFSQEFLKKYAKSKPLYRPEPRKKRKDPEQ